jgi:hypothetical protein
MDTKTIQKLNESDFLPNVCAHVTNGGALPELCKLLELRYSNVIAWIYENPERAKQYELALAARAEWTVQSLLNELKDISLADIRQAYDPTTGELLSPDKWPDALARVVASVETEEIYDTRGKNAKVIGHTKRLKMWDKIRAIELLGKNLKIFKEQIEHTGTITLEALVLGSMKTKEEIICSIDTTQLIAAPPKEILPAEMSKEPDSSSSGKTDLSAAEISDKSPTALS